MIDSPNQFISQIYIVFLSLPVKGRQFSGFFGHMVAKNFRRKNFRQPAPTEDPSKDIPGVLQVEMEQDASVGLRFDLLTRVPVPFRHQHRRVAGEAEDDMCHGCIGIGNQPHAALQVVREIETLRMLKPLLQQFDVFHPWQSEDTDFLRLLVPGEEIPTDFSIPTRTGGNVCTGAV